MLNPFNIRFGRKPESYLGRDQLVYDILSSFDEPNAPENTTLITGLRGSGKTVFLTDIYGRMKDNQDWITIYTSCNEFLIDNIIELITNQLQERETNLTIKSAKIKTPILDIEINRKKASFKSFQVMFENILQILTENNLRLLLLIDEVYTCQAMKTLGQVYQVLYGQGFDVSSVFAGLFHEIQSLKNAKGMTFLHRASTISLPLIDTYFIKNEYIRLFNLRDCTFEESALDKAYLSTYGYPYLYQLIGYYLWKEVKSKTITDSDVENALNISKANLFQNVYAIIFRDLSNKDQAFCFSVAMYEKKNVPTSFISENLSQSSNLTSQYKNRLIEANIIQDVSKGYVAFNLPFFKEFVIEMKKKQDFQ